MYVQPLDGQLGPATLAPLETAENGFSPAQAALSMPLGAADAISRLVPPLAGNALANPLQTALFGPLPGLLQQLITMLQSMMGYQGGAPSGYGGYGGYGSYPGGCSGYGGEQYFTNASGASSGDPHLSFNGSHWDSMSSQPDLLESDSIPGGFQVSTQVTAPNSRGITWNQSATVALDGGRVGVSMNDQGAATIREGDRMIPIAAGQTLNLGNGASVTCNANGSVSVLAQNGSGGRIETTLTAQGQGVNVEANAQNVELGGALVTGSQQAPIYGGPPLDPWRPVVESPTPVGGPITAPGNFPITPPPINMTPY